MQVVKDPLAFAQELLDAESFAGFLRAANEWIEQELEWELAGTVRQAELGRYRARIESLRA